MFDGNSRQTQRYRNSASRDWLYELAEVILALALLSLFLPIKAQLGFVQIRPFEVLTVLLFGIVLARLNKLPAPTFWSGLMILIPYLLWHAVSAFMYTEQSGLRETLQIGAVALFAFSVYALLPVIRFRRLAPLMLFGMTAITAYNAYYHISIGQWFGWKTLDSWGTGDIKYTFEFLPPLVGLLILFGRSRLYLYWLVWAVLGVAIVLSGERKALLAYCLLTVALVTRARIKLAIPVLAGVIVVVSWASSQLDKGYLSTQLNSISDYSRVDHNSFDMIVRGEGPDSLSDSQRIFAFHVGSRMLEDHWLFGVGTNAYHDRVRQDFSSLPDYLLVGIHGEFWRVLVENGVIGFILYVSIWLVAVFRLIKTLQWLTRGGAIDSYAARLIFLLILLPVGFSVAFEAPGTHALVALFIASFSPELAYYALRRRVRAAAPRRDAALTTFAPSSAAGGVI